MEVQKTQELVCKPFVLYVSDFPSFFYSFQILAVDMGPIEAVGTESVAAQKPELASAARKQKAKKSTEADIEFTKALDEDIPDTFAPPKNLKSLLLPANKVPCSNRLPEDCHYQPEDLVKLFLLPNVMVNVFPLCFSVWEGSIELIY